VGFIVIGRSSSSLFFAGWDSRPDGFLKAEEIKLEVTVSEKDVLFSKRDSRFVEFVRFEDSSAKFLELGWSVQVQDDVIILHNKSYVAYVKVIHKTGSIYSLKGHMAVSETQDVEIEIYSSSMENDVKNQDDEEITEELIATLTVLNLKLSPSRVITKSYTPKYSTTSILQVYSTTNDIILEKEITFSNYDQIYSYMSHLDRFIGVFMRKRDGTQYNVTGGTRVYKKCKKVVVLVGASKIDATVISNDFTRD
jgi:hypothetical protein